MSTKTRSTSSLIRIIQGGSGRISVHKSYVVKKVKIKDFPSPTSEIFLLSKLNHPNIIKILSWKVNGEYLSFRLERMEMDLAHFVRENRPDEILLKLRDQMLTVVAYLHSLDVIHGDLTDSNFLVSSDASIRLTDFGTSFYARYTTEVGESLCRLRYDAPESVLFRKECEWEAPPLIKLKKRDSYAIGTNTGSGEVVLFISAPLSYLIKSHDDLGLPVEPCRDASMANMWYTTGEVVLSVFKEAYALLRRAQRIDEQGPAFFGRWVPSIMVKKWVAIRDKVDIQPSTVLKLDYQKANAYGRRIRTRKRSL